MLRVYDSAKGVWRKETKAEVMAKVDIEGKSPCEKCWIKARIGIQSWPLADNVPVKRCLHCNRII
jgi:hypothetical protein